MVTREKKTQVLHAAAHFFSYYWRGSDKNDHVVQLKDSIHRQ